jgi:serine/threonine protein kinase/flagellar motility protein MotE (MotC chaperone)
VRVLNDRYRLAERLGQGAMGSVWKAYDTRLERTVAAKELVSARDGSEDLDIRRERVRREALALAKVEHPAIVSIHDLIYEGPGQDPWIVMAYVRGRSLDVIIKDPRPLEERKVAGIGLAVTQGLMACHERDVYHRDVKPANILLGDNGAVRLVDFGIARIVGKNALTVDSNVIGTPEFLAPELFTDHHAGPATDLWALGVTLYYALEGRSPFRAETLPATIAAILSKNLAEPRTRGEVAALVLTMLRKHPEERPDAATVAAVLRRVAGAPQATRPNWQPTRPTQATQGTRAMPSMQSARTAQLSAQNHAQREAQDPPRKEQPRRTAPIKPVRAALRHTPLHGMPALDAAKIISDWPTDRAVTDLLTLGGTQAAKIINRCEDPVAGKLLTGIAADDPARARKVLEMVTTERAGRLIDHMSSLAAASALSLPTSTGAVRVLGQADDLTVAGVLLEMEASSAARLIMAMDTERGAKLLGQAAPVTVADILRNLPALRRTALMNRLAEPFRSLVARHL